MRSSLVSPNVFRGRSMHRRILSVLVALVILTGVVIFGRSPDGRGDDKPASPKPSGLEKRVPWTTSQVRGSPEPPSPYKTEVAFPKLKFDEPLDMQRIPGTDRLVVTERYGRVFTFPNNPSVEKPDLLIDLNERFGKTAPKSLAAYGFAAHPKFVDNGFVYITIVPDLSQETPKGTRVSRFHVPPGNPPRCDLKSEQVIIEWASGGHNGGCLQFGPDGHRYIDTSDSSRIREP